MFSLIAEKYNKYKNYFVELFALAFPLLIGNLGHNLIGVTDILVIAKYDINSLAAASISNAILFTILILGLGVIDAVFIILSNKRGAKERTKKYLLSSLIFSFLISLLFTLICLSTVLIVPYMGFEQHLISDIKTYISIVSFSLFAMFLFQGMRSFLLSFEIVKLPNIIIMISVIFNLIFDLVFVFGFGPIPAMGVTGAAIATLLVRILCALILFFYIYKFIDWKSKIDFSYMKNVFKVGLPIGVALMFEFLAFNIITILVGREAGILSATHNVLVSLSSVVFMIPMTISTAVSVKVAYFYGALKKLEIKRYSLAALIIGVGFMIFVSLLLILFPKQIINLYTDNQQVLSIALPIIIVVAVYQIFDGVQAVAAGILKGFKMTKVVSTGVLLAYCAVGMPVAFICVGKYNMSLKGYWIALAVSIIVMAFVFGTLSFVKYKKLKS